jgi:hypothetical protein
MSKKNRELTPEENEWCETLCICGHMRVWHLDQEEIDSPEWGEQIPKGMVELYYDEVWCIDCDTELLDTIDTDNDDVEPQHVFKVDNLRYLEMKYEQSIKTL